MDMNAFILRIAIGIPGLLAAIVLHEWAHAYVAHLFGDDTAKRQGRLSLNPAAHYDLFGTIIFPLIGAILGGVMFGWAKPVPVNPARFKNVKSGIFWVSFAGPIANIIIALVMGFTLAAMYTVVPESFYFRQEFIEICRAGVSINLVIAVFNLIPFPPLDGSKMLSTFLSYEAARKYENLGRYSFLFIMLLWMTPIFSYIITPTLKAANFILAFFVAVLS